MRLVAAALWAAAIARATAQPAGYAFVGVTSSVMMQREALISRCVLEIGWLGVPISRCDLEIGWLGRKARFLWLDVLL